MRNFVHGDDSGYLGIVVLLYVDLHDIIPYLILDPESKTDGTAEIYIPFYLYMYVYNLNF